MVADPLSVCRRFLPIRLSHADLLMLTLSILKGCSRVCASIGSFSPCELNAVAAAGMVERDSITMQSIGLQPTAAHSIDLF